MDEKLQAKADETEAKIEAATGIKGSKGNWFSEHPALLVSAVAVLLILIWLL